MSRLERPGSPAFWSGFMQRSRELRVPVHLRGAFREPLCTMDDVMDVLRAVPRAGNRFGVRLYVGGAESPPRDAHLRDHPPRDGETLEEWSERVFGGEPYGIVINGAEEVSDRLSRNVAAFLDPFLDRWGMPWGGVDIAFFIGNYGLTPFGIHRDARTHVMHVHLGPASKEMSLWSPAVYRRSNGSWEESFDMAGLQPHARRFVLCENDFFYLPPTYYHIGNTPELSAAMTISFVDTTDREFLSLALSEALDRMVPAEAGPEGPEAMLAAAAGGDAPLSEWVRESLEDLSLSLTSNHGLRFAPQPRPADAAVVPEDTLHRIAPFRITFDRREEQLVHFMRRSRFVAPFSRPLVSLLERLNASREVAVSEVVRAVAPSMSETGALALVGSWVGSRGVEIAR